MIFEKSGEYAMRQDTIELIEVDQVEYQYFDSDPEGEPDRAGDGIYFQLPGEVSWSGPWHSQDQAEGEAHQALEDREIKAIIDDLKNEGYLCVEKNDDRMSFVTKVEDRWFAVDVTADRVRARETFGIGQNSDISVMDFEPEDGVFGYRHRAAKQAIEAVAEEIGNQPTMRM
jgi:hypothetical protein